MCNNSNHMQGYECLSASIGSILNYYNKQITGNEVIILGSDIKVYYNKEDDIIGSNMYESNFEFLNKYKIYFEQVMFKNKEDALAKVEKELNLGNHIIIKLEAGSLSYNKIFRQANEANHYVWLLKVNSGVFKICDNYVPTREPSCFLGNVSSDIILNAWEKKSYELIVIKNCSSIRNIDLKKDIEYGMKNYIKNYLLGGKFNNFYIGKDVISFFWNNFFINANKLSKEKIINYNFQLKIYGFISLKRILNELLLKMNTRYSSEYKMIIHYWESICLVLVKYAFSHNEKTKKQLYDDAYDCMEKEEKILQHILLEIEN